MNELKDDIKCVLTDSFRNILLRRAERILRIKNTKQHCEDIVQNAFYILFKYQKSLNTKNYEKLMNWLVTQESYRQMKSNIKYNSLYFRDFDVSETILKNPRFAVQDTPKIDFKILQEQFDKFTGLHPLNTAKHRRRLIKEYFGTPKQAQILITLRNTKVQKNYDAKIKFKKKRSKKLSV